MGYYKTLFMAWKARKYPDIKFGGGQIEWIHAYFRNVEAGEDEPLPKVKGMSECQQLVGEFWEDMEGAMKS